MNERATIQVQRDSVNEEAGTFEAAVFTNGEASDGHILDIQGGDIPEQIPLFVNHYADPVEQLGSLRFVRKTKNEVIMRGELHLEGEGPMAAIRRDLMSKIAAGHVSRLSGRWDAERENTTPRTELPKNHYAYVSKAEDGPKRYGRFFRKWTAMEGSIVGLGADPAATMRWADEAEDEDVAQFWRSATDTIVETEVKTVSRDGQLAAFRAYVRELEETGLSIEEMRESLEVTEEDIQDEPGEANTLLLHELRELVEQAREEITAELRRQTVTQSGDGAAEAPQEEEPAEAVPPMRLGDLARVFRVALDESDARLEAKLGDMLKVAKGEF